MKISPKKIAVFQKKILSFYADNGRVLPWRKTRNPYRILVSEVMLQQTQVDRVIPFYKRFLKSYPSLSSLAKADTPALLAHWSGLGYNNRVLRLRSLAQVSRSIPNDFDDLLKLPGIGPYTAGAILAFAFNKEVPVVDTNIRRVMIHEFGLPEDISVSDLEQFCLSIIPKGHSRVWHNALMDWGATVKTAKETGIASLSKQSKFEGSNRFLRGQIVKSLLKSASITFFSLKKSFPDYSPDRIKKIMDKMQAENIIKIKDQSVSLT